MVAINAGMRNLVSHPDPAVVFEHLAQLLVPAVCDEATAEIQTSGTNSSEVHRGVRDPSGGPPDYSPSGPVDPVAEDTNAGEAPARFVVTSRFGAAPALPATTVAGIGGGGADYEVVLTCTWWARPPTGVETALVDLLGRCAAAAVQQARQAEELSRAGSMIENLQVALVSNRTIGAAVGVLMARHHLTDERAFTLLAMTSQRCNMKVAALAEEVLLTGELPA